MGPTNLSLRGSGLDDEGSRAHRVVYSKIMYYVVVVSLIYVFMWAP